MAHFDPSNVTDMDLIVRIVGTTDDVTTCECCGRQDLRQTVVCETERGNYVYLGCVCAAKRYAWDSAAYDKALGRASKAIERLAQKANEAKRNDAMNAYFAHPNMVIALRFELQAKRWYALNNWDKCDWAKAKYRENELIARTAVEAKYNLKLNA